jgi:hypothetical protein
MATEAASPKEAARPPTLGVPGPPYGTSTSGPRLADPAGPAYHLIRRYPYRRPDPFRSVRDLGLISPRFPGVSGASEGRSSAWLPARATPLSANGFKRMCDLTLIDALSWAFRLSGDKHLARTWPWLEVQTGSDRLSAWGKEWHGAGRWKTVRRAFGSPGSWIDD